MKKITIPLDFTTTPTLYETKQAFNSADINSAVLVFTTGEVVTGMVANLTLKNITQNANTNAIVIKRIDVNTAPFEYTLQNELQQTGAYYGEIELKKDGITLASASFTFGINKSLSSSVLPRLVQAYSLDDLVERVETEVDNLKAAYETDVTEATTLLNAEVARIESKATIWTLNENQAKANELVRIANNIAWQAAEEARVIEFNNLVDSNIIAQNVSANLTDKYQEVESIYPTRLLSVEQQLEQTETFITPHQFGAIGNGIVDDTIAIQNAVNNAAINGGFVSFKRATYRLSSTIFIPYNVSIDFNYSIIIPATGGTFTDNYLFRINSTSGTTWDEIGNQQLVFFRNLKVYNDIKLVVKILLLGQSAEIKNIESRYVYGVIKTTEDYIDNKRIIGINTSEPLGTDFIIEIKGLGDACVIENCHVMMWDIVRNYINHISIVGGQGKMNGIVNGCVQIYNSEYTLDNIHIEKGKLILRNSKVGIDNILLFKPNNFIPIVIQDDEVLSGNGEIASPVTINNLNMVVRLYSNDYTTYYDDIDIVNYKGYLKLFNCLRTNSSYSGEITEGFKTGISIKNGDTSNIISQFIDYAVFKRELIYEKEILCRSAVVYGGISRSLSAIWKAPVGSYYYKYCLLYDPVRRIGVYEQNKGNVIISSVGEKAVILKLDVYENCNLRILRGAVDGVYTQYVDIPCKVGVGVLDNGLSVNGFTWKDVGGDSTITNAYFNNNVTKIRFSRDKIVAHMVLPPTLGSWLVGDIVYNNSPSAGSYVGWVCTTAGSPGTWKGFGAIQA